MADTRGSAAPSLRKLQMRDMPLIFLKSSTTAPAARTPDQTAFLRERLTPDGRAGIRGGSVAALQSIGRLAITCRLPAARCPRSRGE